MKIFGIVGIVLLLASCQEEPILLRNGLTKGANKISEIFMKVETDSVGTEFYDTISITEKLYDTEDKIVIRKQETLIDKELLEIDYKYNELGLLEQEIVRMSYDSSEIIVEYHYQDTILNSTTSKSETEEMNFSQEVEYFYHSNGKLKKLKTNYVLIFSETADTTMKQEIDNFNKAGVKTKSETINRSDSKERRYTTYKYDRQFLKQTKLFDYKDSLMSNTNFVYEVDNFGNWIERKSIENEKLVYRSKRIIEYR